MIRSSSYCRDRPLAIRRSTSTRPARSPEFSPRLVPRGLLRPGYESRCSGRRQAWRATAFHPAATAARPCPVRARARTPSALHTTCSSGGTRTPEPHWPRQWRRPVLRANGHGRAASPGIAIDKRPVAGAQGREDRRDQLAVLGAVGDEDVHGVSGSSGVSAWRRPAVVRDPQPAGAGADLWRVQASAGPSSNVRARLGNLRCRAEWRVWCTSGSNIDTKGGRAEARTDRTSPGAVPGSSFGVGSGSETSPHCCQSSPNSSTGCCVRSEPLPQASESAGQYLSQPQQMR